MQAVNVAPWFKELLADQQPPCVSIYLPVDRTPAPDNQMPAAFQEALDEVRRSVGGKSRYGNDAAQAAIARIEESMRDPANWEGRRDALAFFASPVYFQLIELRRPIERLVNVADSFHVKPLIRTLQMAQPFHVLCVAPRGVRLFEGDSTSLTEVPLRNVPRSVDDPLAVEATGPSTTPATGGRSNGSSTTGQPFHSGTSVPTDRFFRLVDKAIWENHSRRARLPIVVVADVQYLSDFLSIAKNENVLKEGVKLNPDAATPERLREEAWRILEPKLQAQMQTLKDAYHAARARQLGSDAVPEVAEAAAVGRVGTLLVDSDAKIPGILHRDSGVIETAPMSDPRVDDVLDDLAELVLKTDGQVFVLPHDQMPTEAGVAAVYRY